MKKKDTPEAKQFWALAELTSEVVKGWPQWKQDFAAGYQVGEAKLEPRAATQPTRSDVKE